MHINDDMVYYYNTKDIYFRCNIDDVYVSKLLLKFKKLVIDIIFSDSTETYIENIQSFLNEYFIIHGKFPNVCITGVEEGYELLYNSFLKSSYSLYINYLDNNKTNFNTKDYIKLRYINDIINELYHYNIDEEVMPFKIFEIKSLVNIINGE